MIYVGGYLIMPSLGEDALAERLREARDRGTRIVLDVAVPVGQELPADAAQMLLPLADYFVPNVDEAFALTGETDPQRQAEQFLDHGANAVVIKLGERGAYVRGGDEEFIAAHPES